MALLFAARRELLGRPPRDRARPQAIAPVFRGDTRLRFGMAAMFAYVGAEVTLGALLTNYLVLPTVLAAAPATAGRLVSLYWAGAMAGRFAGAWLLGRFRPAAMLGAAASGAAALVLIGAGLGGPVGAGALLGVGLCNAIMYPIIYTLALSQTSGGEAPIGSMFLCMVVVGGAVVPYLTGVAADATGLGRALLLPGACYFTIAVFARRCAR